MSWAAGPDWPSEWKSRLVMEQIIKSVNVSRAGWLRSGFSASYTRCSPTRTTWYRFSLSCSSASFIDATAVALSPHRFIHSPTARPMILCSSIMSTCSPAKKVLSMVAGRCSEAMGREMRNQKCEPSPSSLSIPIFPPMSSTSCLLIASPRPVPPNSRVVEESPWENFLNSWDMPFLEIPMPVSFTEKPMVVSWSVPATASTSR